MLVFDTRYFYYSLILYYFYTMFLEHTCAHVKLIYCVTTDFLQSDLFLTCFISYAGIDESEISYVCIYACMYNIEIITVFASTILQTTFSTSGVEQDVHLVCSYLLRHK
jgi:hypothetical protein